MPAQPRATARTRSGGTDGGDSARRPDPARAWEAYQPGPEQPWNLARAAHLLRRAGFGCDWPRLQQALVDGPQKSVDRLVRPDGGLDAFQKTFDRYEASAGSIDGLRAWWLRRMLQTPFPLLEKTALFWLDHFGAGSSRVSNAQLVALHLAMLRSFALGRFDAMLQAVSRDPAVLVALASDENRRAMPNDRYARHLLLDFCLGPGNFSESDVQESARALTGWFVLRDELRYFPREHDDGVKRVLGREGNFQLDDIVRIVLQQTATPRLIVRKLYRWLVSETDEPSDDLLGPLAESLAADYDIGRVVETMLRSRMFFSPAAYRQRVKSPVEYALGIVQALEGVVSTTELGQDLAGVGQDLCNPPTVKGWAGGRHWLSAAAVVGRSNLAAALLATAGPYENRLDPLAVARRHGFAEPAAARQFLVDLLLGGDLDEKVQQALLRDDEPPAAEPALAMRRFAHLLVTLPEFQLA